MDEWLCSITNDNIRLCERRLKLPPRFPISLPPPCSQLVGSIILGFVKVYLFRTRPHDMIRWAFYFQTGMLAVMAIFSFAGGSFFGGVMFAMMAALTYYLLKYWTVQLDLTARLFGVRMMRMICRAFPFSPCSQGLF